MLASLIRRRWPVALGAFVVVLVALGGALAASGGPSQEAGALSGEESGAATAASDGQQSAPADALGGDPDARVVVYNGRSHYGDEQAFEDFEEETGIEVVLRGGTAPELFERLRREGEDTPADLLVTTDLANLWRAEEAGLLQGVSTPTLEANIPASLRDPQGAWWALSTRIRTPVVSTDLPPGSVTSYEGLGDPRFKGRTCLRTSASEYNQSLVADMIAKRGAQATRELLSSWMANEPEILGSDGELLGVMAGGDCTVGLSNHYYLGRALKEDPDFPVRPAWPDQDGAGAHTNVSGVGLVTWSNTDVNAVKLMEHLTSRGAQEQIIELSEFAANPDVPPAEHLRDWAGVKLDPIAVEEAGPLLDEAVALMLEAGWE
jgi:iron(III) transport system substrate-binding protein